MISNRYIDKDENEDLNERNLLNNLKSNSEAKRFKALLFAKKNFNYLDNYTIIELSKDIPLFLMDSDNQIVETTLNIILSIHSGNMIEHIETRTTLINMIEKAMLFEEKNIFDKCELIINMFLQNMESCDYLSILKSVLKTENPRVIKNTFSFINMGLEEFGIRNLNYLKDILPILENFMKSINGIIIESGIYLYKQIYKYMGEALLDSIAKLSKHAQKELKKFTSTWGKIKLTGKRDIGMLQEEDLDAEAPVNIWSKYTEEWTRRILLKDHWKDKLPELRDLERDLTDYRLPKGNYSKVLDVLKSCTNDAHVLIKIKSIKSIGLLCKGLKKDFKEYVALFNYLLPLFKSGTKRIIEVLEETYEVISNYLKLTDITHIVCDALMDNNPDYKINILNFLESMVKLKFDNNLVNEVEYFRDHTEKVLIDLSEDAKLEVRNKAKKLNNLLKERLLGIKMSISESFSSIDKKKCLNKLNQDFSEISDIIQNESSKLSIQNSPVYSRQNTNIQSHVKIEKPKFDQRKSIVIKPLELKKRNSFLRNDITSSKNFLNSQTNLNDNIKKNYQSNRKFEGFNNFLLTPNIPSKQKNLNVIEPHMEKSLVLSQDDDSLIIEKINWSNKKEKLLKNILKVFNEYEDIPFEELNEVLMKLQKETNDFKDVMALSQFSTFCKFIALKDSVEINEKTFLILKQIISMDLQKGTKMSTNFTEKLIQNIGPFRFFKLILTYIQEKGFSHKNFVYILYQLCQNINPDLLYDAHIVLVYRNLKFFFTGIDFEKEFLNLLHHIIQARFFYLKEIYIELSYINFGELFEIEEQEYMKFPNSFYEEMKQMGQESMAQGSDQGVVDINEDIKSLLEFFKNNPRKKKEVLDQLLSLLLRNPKFSLKNKIYDAKLQDLWSNCLASNETNKIILKSLSRIIFLFSHCYFGNEFEFQTKHLNGFMSVFLKEKNEEVRKNFTYALKRHLIQEKGKTIYNYFKLLEDKNIFMKMELLELLFDFFDNQSEKFILKIDKKKVFPILFKLINSKKSQIKSKTTDLLNFLLSFFSQKEMKANANKISKEAFEFVNNFYLLSSHNRIETIDKSIKIESNNSFRDSRIEKKDNSNSISLNTNQPLVKITKGINDDFIDFNKLANCNLPLIIENLAEAIHLIFHFKISEFLRNVLYQNGLNNLSQFEIILKKMLEPHIILLANLIPLFLSIIFNLLTRYPKNELIFDFCLTNLSLFVDSLKTEKDDLFCLESEEFSLFIEVIVLFNFEAIDKIEIQDQIVQNLILYHIKTEEKEDMINLIRNLDENTKWLETFLVTEKIDDIFEQEDHDCLSPADKIIYSFAFSTKDFILDILIENKFFNEMDNEDYKDLIIAFIFLLKRMKKTIFMTNNVNENFLSFIMNKFEEILSGGIDDIKDDILRDIFKVIIQLLYLEPTYLHPKLQTFLKNLIKNLPKLKIAKSLTLLNFEDEELNNYLNTILVRTLENETTDTLVDIAVRANLVEYDTQNNKKDQDFELNKIGIYLVDIVNTKERIQQDMREMEELNDLIEEYNNFKW